MDEYTFTNLASKFYFQEDGSENYKLITSDLGILLKAFDISTTNELYVGKEIALDGKQYKIGRISVKLYEKKKLGKEYEGDYDGAANDFTTEIWFDIIAV
jgi:hypothetical protein